MKEAEIIGKRNELLAQESSGLVRWWWLSFCDPHLPEGSQFLGVSLVRANGFVAATMLAGLANLNPGGEVSGFEIPDNFVMPSEYLGRLLSRQEVEMLDNEFERQGSL